MFAFAARTSPRECTRRRHVSLALGLAIVVALGCNTVRAEPATARPVVIVAARTPFAAFVAEASQRFGIPAAWISAVMRAESFGDVRAISPKGAIGLMQIMPETWAGLQSALPSRRRSLRRARQHHRRRRLSARAARPLRHSRLPRGLQCRSRALGRPSRDRPAAAGGDARLCRPSRANRRRKCNRRHGHSRRRGEVLDRGVVVSSRSSSPSERHSLCTDAAIVSAVDRAFGAGLDRARAAVRWAVRRPVDPGSGRNEPRSEIIVLWRAVAEVCVWWRGGTGTQPTDGKGKGRPSARRMWLVGLRNSPTPPTPAAGALCKFSQRISMLRAPSPRLLKASAP